MELAVPLTCSYLGSSHPGSTSAEDPILDYYRQIRPVEARLKGGLLRAGEDLEEDEEMTAAD